MEDNENPEKKKSLSSRLHTMIAYPKSVFFIVGNEFCERFSFYGMRTVLTIYLRKILSYSEDSATMIYHVFSMAAYFTPLLGAFIADSWLGKFKTIFYISIIYILGNILISVGSIPASFDAMNIMSMLGLVFIALGTGGIKPCVSAFGGDQFEPGQEKHLQKFFSFFYLAINLGSLFSTFITPILRDDVHCFGDKSCFSLAFGVPAILMIVALIIFLIGKPLYKIRPLEGNVVWKVCKCIKHAISNKIISKEKKKDHWLDHADDTYDESFINDIKVVLHVLVLYLPLPIFWALFDQQGSRWTFQATRLDGTFFSYNIKPDQMQFLNPFLVIILIPTFEYIVYPIFGKFNLLVKPLQRLTVGGVLAALSFVLAGFLQIHIESQYPVLPEAGLSDIFVINNSPCTIKINDVQTLLNAHSYTEWKNMRVGETSELNIEGCPGIAKKKFDLRPLSTVEILMISPSEGEMKVVQIKSHKEKHEKGLAEIKFYYSTKNKLVQNGTVYFEVKGSETTYKLYASPASPELVGYTDEVGLDPGRYKIFFTDSSTNKSVLLSDSNIHSGGSYVGILYENPDNGNITFNLVTTVSPNSASILLQVPQYFVMTVGEVMFSISGLEFSYSQAPKSMKSVLQAAWLCTVAFGNLIVVIVAEAKLVEKQSIEFFFFAVLMGVDMLLFAVMAYFYKYVEEPSDQPPQVVPITEKKSGIANAAFSEDTHL